MPEAVKKREYSKYFTAALCVLWLLVQLYFSLIKPAHPMVHVPVFLAFAVSISFSTHPSKRSWMRIVDYLFIAASLLCGLYYISQSQRIVYRIPHITKLEDMDIIVSVILILLLMEAVRRVLGLSLYFFVWFFVAYAFLGNFFPGFMNFSGMKLGQFIENATMTTDGIFGTPLTTAANYIFYFMLFGAFFSNCGGGQVLIDIGLKSSDPRSGGPAKAAVISSGLMGMISGSAVANVSTTGVLTIPMMKKVGYTPEQAGAIEAVASTGGQIMPPIMGVGAFIMAELLGVKYAEVAMAAVIPAVAYFGSVLLLVGFLAKRNSHQRDTLREQSGATEDLDALRFNVKPILPRLYLLIPALVLVYFVLTGMSLRRSAMYAIVAVLAILLMVRNYKKDVKVNLIRDLKMLWTSLMDGIRQCADIALPTAACGIIITVVIQSGLASRFSRVVSAIGGSNLLLALLITMLGCMLLGMALPTVAAYLVAVVLFVPILQGLGIPLLVCHMFCFYFGIVAQITPPVCLASFTAAGIAGADSWKTGWTGFRYALVAFLIPFIFVYQPAILLLGTPGEIAYSAFVLLVGTYALAASMAGYLFAPLDNLLERGALFAIAFLLITPEFITDVIGLVLLILVAGRSLYKKKKAERELVGI